MIVLSIINRVLSKIVMTSVLNDHALFLTLVRAQWAGATCLPPSAHMWVGVGVGAGGAGAEAGLECDECNAW